MMFLKPAAMSRPTCRARIVLPFTIPKTWDTVFPGSESVVVVIISAILLFARFMFYIFPFLYFVFFFVEED